MNDCPICNKELSGLATFQGGKLVKQKGELYCRFCNKIFKIPRHNRKDEKRGWFDDRRTG